MRFLQIWRTKVAYVARIEMNYIWVPVNILGADTRLQIAQTPTDSCAIWYAVAKEKSNSQPIDGQYLLKNLFLAYMN